MKLKRSFLADPNGLFGSNRRGHVFAASLVALTVFGIAVALRTEALRRGMSWSGYWPAIDWSHQLAWTAPLVYLWELGFTYDLDHSSRKIRGTWAQKLFHLYWYPYRRLIPHRDRLSHSLLIGTPLRAFYALLPLLGFYVFSSYSYARLYAELSQMESFNATMTSLEAGIWWFFHRLENNVFIWLGPAIADLTHLLKDGYLQRYGVMGILLGKPERFT